MIKENKILAVIPARGGSKRLKNKNIKCLNHKPLIAWTIEESKKSEYIDKICVSTDSEDIARVSAEYNCLVDFMRPNELSGDYSSSVDVLLHAVNFYKKRKEDYDILVLLQPTSPLRSVDNIDRAIEYYIEKNAGSVISVCETEHPPLWSNTLPNNLSMQNFIRPEIKEKRSQDFPVYYR